MALALDVLVFFRCGFALDALFVFGPRFLPNFFVFFDGRGFALDLLVFLLGAGFATNLLLFVFGSGLSLGLLLFVFGARFSLDGVVEPGGPILDDALGDGVGFALEVIVGGTDAELRLNAGAPCVAERGVACRYIGESRGPG